MKKNTHKAIMLLMTGTVLCMLLISATGQEPDINGYEADKPLSVHDHDIIKGGLTYSVGDSYYSGKLYSGDTYTVLYSVSLPDSANVKFARLYNYWTWSAQGNTGVFPDMTLNFDRKELTPEIKYEDRKGWDKYDYPSGNWIYDVTDHINGSGSHSVIIEHTGSADAFFSISGLGLLIVYTDEAGEDMEYWINEGCDILNSQMNDDGTPRYYTTPDETITKLISPTISQDTVQHATLWTIVQGGNWEENVLKVNDANITGIFDGTPYPDMDIDERDIGEYLKDGKNIIQFQAVGDYAIPCGSILVINKGSGTASVPLATGNETSEDTPVDTPLESTSPADTPGFGIIPAVVMLLTIIFFNINRDR
ncbi:MAG: DUF3344 domain-containing protein [Methanosarcinales archaeon]|nr:DUF3344 domain-containing protein [Methanosarcinales archaeon]